MVFDRIPPVTRCGLNALGLPSRLWSAVPPVGDFRDRPAPRLAALEHADSVAISSKSITVSSGSRSPPKILPPPSGGHQPGTIPADSSAGVSISRNELELDSSSADQVVIGLLANTCHELTGRFAKEPGDYVTLVTDMTDATSP